MGLAPVPTDRRAPSYRRSGVKSAAVSETTSTARPPIAAIGMGASAGGLRPLREVVAGLPADLPAAVFAVLHVSATGTSVLPEILQRATALEVVRAEDGLPVRPGCVVVAPPDRHLVVEAAPDGGAPRIRLTLDPRENGHRPAIDPLLRSLAATYGERAAGVILSGSREDGATGLAQLKAAGGAALVQNPADADHPSMPVHALAATAVDAALPVPALAPALIALAHGRPLVPFEEEIA